MSYETMAFARTNKLVAAIFVAVLAAASGACGGGNGDDGDGGSGGEGGDGGGSAGGGKGGSGGGKGGSGGGSGGGLESRAVDNCTKAKTVAEVETKIINSKCAGAGCHRDSNQGDFRNKMGKSWIPSYIDAEANLTCKGDKLFDKDDPENGLMFRIIQDDPKCQDDSATPNSKMPPSNALSQLTDEEKTCLEEYIRVVSAD